MGEKSHVALGSSNVFTREDMIETDMRTIRKKLKQGLRESLVVIGLSNILSVESFDSCTDNGQIFLNIIVSVDPSKKPSIDDNFNLVWVRSVKSNQAIDVEHTVLEGAKYKLTIAIPYTTIKNVSKYRVATIFSMARMVDRDIKL